MKKTLIASGLVLSVSFGLGMGVSFLTGMDGALAREATLPTITEIDSLPEASVRTRSGDQVFLADLRGDGATAFVIFSTKCGMSFAEALVWQRLSDSLERAGMSLVGITTDADWNAVDELQRHAKLTFPLVMMTPSEARAAGVQGYPTVFAVEQSGNVIFAETGALATSRFEAWTKGVRTAGRQPEAG